MAAPHVERVTGIEPVWPAWKADGAPAEGPDTVVSNAGTPGSRTPGDPMIENPFYGPDFHGEYDVASVGRLDLEGGGDSGLPAGLHHMG